MRPYELGLQHYGTREIAGGKHNPKVLEYFKEVGHGWVKDDETAWCAAFAGYCLKKTGYLTSGKLNARSFLDLPNAGITAPRLGDILIFWRIASDSPYGHVGFYIAENDDNYWVLGGNQSNMVCIREYPKLRLLGIRRPVKNE